MSFFSSGTPTLLWPWTISRPYFWLEPYAVTRRLYWDGGRSLQRSVTEAQKELYCRRPLKLEENVSSLPTMLHQPSKSYLFPSWGAASPPDAFLKHKLKIMRQILNTTCFWQRPLSISLWKKINLARGCSSGLASFTSWPGSLCLSDLADVNTQT